MSTNNSMNEMSVLLVDDDDVAQESVIRSFRKNNIPFDVITAFDGIEAIEILRKQHPSKSISKPFIILLDLNMPRMNGFEFLETIRNDPELSSNIVFVLTTSNDDNDRLKAYEQHIAGYMIKSAVGPQFLKVCTLLTQYKDAITLPKRDEINEPA